MKTVVCPGSFDPITNGHMDIIRRASGIFDRVIVLVASNQEKRCFFTARERADMIRRVVLEEGLPNVEVDQDDGLLVNYIQRVGAVAIVKGLRAVSDFEYEFQQTALNYQLDSDLETIFIMSPPEYMYLSSSVVREIASFHGDLTQFVPDCVRQALEEKFGD